MWDDDFYYLLYRIMGCGPQTLKQPKLERRNKTEKQSRKIEEEKVQNYDETKEIQYRNISHLKLESVVKQKETHRKRNMLKNLQMNDEQFTKINMQSKSRPQGL